MALPATTAARIAAGFVPGPAPVHYDLLEPAAPTGKPTLVMVHGGAHSGQGYLRTVDGRPGWALRFVERGYRVVLPDWPGTGRSGHVPVDKLTGAVVCAGLGAVIEEIGGPVVLFTHSMSGAYGWKLVERHGARIAKLVAAAPGLPGNIQPQPRIIRESETEVELQSLQLTFKLSKTEPYVSTRAFVDAKIVGTGSRFPRALVDGYATLLRAIPPRLLFERLNVGGAQLKIADTAPFRGKPVLIVTGTHDIDHPREVDGAIADWLKGIGAACDFCFLGDIGIAGNGHMLMLEDNSDELAALIAAWIETGKTPPRGAGTSA